MGSKPNPPFFVVSDTHFFHDNIVKYSGRDTQIKDIAGSNIDHNEYMVQRWNQVVGQGDKILHLGDLYAWFKNGREKFEQQILPRLNGDKYLIMGNHDRDPASEYERMGFTVLAPFMTVINGQRVSFNHYPLEPSDCRPGEIRVHGHIHNNGYPITDNWRKGCTSTRPRHINVSVEVINYTPILITELV